MSYTQDLFTSRRNYGDGNTRIGHLDRIWYDKVTHTLRIGDGSTPGGLIILGGGGGSGIIMVKDESLILTAVANSLNFLGAGVTATVGNALTGDVDVTIPGGIAGVAVSDEGTIVAATANSMNFVGAGVTATATGNVVTVTIPTVSNTIIVEDEGSTSTAASTLNFIGAGVTATVSISGEAQITIPGASNTIEVEDEGLALSLPVTAINFIGDRVYAVYNNGVADVTVTGTGQQLSTWVPVLKTNTGTGVFTYTKQEGRYVKTGRHVTCYFTIQVSAQTITTPSSIQIINLPFTSFDTTAGAGVSEHIGNLVLDYFEFGDPPTHVSGKVLGGTTKVELYWHGVSAGPSAYIALLNNDNLTFPDQDYVMVGTITYITETDIPADEPPR